MSDDRSPVRIRVNGTWHTFEIDSRTVLIELLRDRLNLTGTKNGCGSGHCGACTVLVDGEAVRACIYKARRAHEKTVETIEGLARGNVLHPLQRAFIQRGAVQCGYCTPGMIMSAKALLDHVPDPTDEQIKTALKQNFCRCTGYKKIIEAVHAAAGMAADPRKTPSLESGEFSVIGRRMARTEALGRVTGEVRYTGDLVVEGMLRARVLRSAYPHALLRGIDVSRARQMPGVVAVLTADDVPGAKNHGVLAHDWPVLAYDKVRYVGDALAIVAAETEDQAEAALSAIAVDYEPLPVITGPEEGLAPGAVLAHEKGNVLKYIEFSKGDVEAGLAASDLVIENTYQTPFGEHAFLEPEASLAVPEAGGGVTVYVGSQIPFEDRLLIAASLALPLEKVRVVHMPTGGAFGGKEDVIGQIQTALVARLTGRPVRLVLSRSESMRTHPKRHATKITMKSGITRDGRVLAQKIRILGDTGAYASLGGPVMTRAATHSTGPYEVPNVAVECYAVYTNNPPAGAFRGFGATQAHFAAESQMDVIAEAVGLSPFELRRRNALKVGSSTATGQVLRDSVGLLDCLARVEAAMGEALAAQPEPELPPHIRRGWGVAAVYKNVGLGTGLADSAGAIVEILPSGRVYIRAGAAEVGQGHDDVLRQIAAEMFGLSPADVDVLLGDTALTPDSGATTASRQTYVTGNAVKYAALEVRTVLGRTAAELLGCDPASLCYEGGSVIAPESARSLPFQEVVKAASSVGRSLKASYIYTPPATVPLGKPGDSHFAFGYGAQAAHVEVNTETGQVRVLDVIAAHDAGRVMNPLAVEGQVEGGIMMGIGYALTERFVVEEGYVHTDTLAKYKIPDITYTPRITCIAVEHPTIEGPFGAKGIGEITSMPTAPAITNAIYRTIGLRSFSLPVSPDAIKAAGAKSGKEAS
jgi:selenium-dependent xanthine dehydrogenase